MLFESEDLINILVNTLINIKQQNSCSCYCWYILIGGWNEDFILIKLFVVELISKMVYFLIQQNNYIIIGYLWFKKTQILNLYLYNIE